MKNILYFAVPTVLAISSIAYAGNVEKVYFNNEEIRFSQADNGKILLPARDLFETAGLTVQWFDDIKRVTAFNEDINITLIDNSDIVYVNNIAYKADCEIGIKNGEFFIDEDTALLTLGGKSDHDGNSVFISSDIAETTDGWQYEVFELINQIRRENGLPEFIWNIDLELLARDYGQDMAVRGYFSHEDPEGLTPFDRMEMRGLDFICAAENLAAGQPSPETVVKAWMESDGHRQNILNPELRECGIAVVRGGKYGIYWVNEFMTCR